MPDIEQLIRDAGGPLPTEAPEAQIFARAKTRRTRRQVAQVALSLALMAGVSAVVVTQLTKPSVEFAPADQGGKPKGAGPAACGFSGAPNACTTYVDKQGGMTLRYPQDWKVVVQDHTDGTAWSVTTGTEAMRDLSHETVETAPGYDCALPGEPLALMDGDGALVTVQSTVAVRPKAFPPLPDRFAMADGQRSPDYVRDCAPPPGVTMTGFTFRNGGRFFRAVIALGPDASRRTRDTALAVLNEVEPKDLRPQAKSVD